MGPHVVGVLLAAGRSTRMGRTKALLPWDGRTLVEFQTASLLEAGADLVLIVTGHDADAVAAAARRTPAAAGHIRVVHNAGYDAGRAGSIRTGAAAVPDEAAVVLLLSVDQPRPAALCAAVAAALEHSSALIAVPRVDGRGGHPVAFAGALLPELRAVTEAGEGARAVLRAHAAATLTVAVDDRRALLDLNTPEDYGSGRAAFGLLPLDPFADCRPPAEQG